LVEVVGEGFLGDLDCAMGEAGLLSAGPPGELPDQTTTVETDPRTFSY
jgi:hypothetical protein